MLSLLSHIQIGTLLLLCVINELEEQVSIGYWIAHVRPSHMRRTVRAIGDVDVVSMERRASLATGYPGLKEYRMGWVRWFRIDDCLDKRAWRSLCQRRVV